MAARNVSSSFEESDTKAVTESADAIKIPVLKARIVITFVCVI
ncbi:hypothetical protein PLIP_a3256 [Pseudoalteromonas lipolytica LMEB 39]|nr:hypothetical protein [Pseudoalteromonas lipolytica LMEB 39]